MGIKDALIIAFVVGVGLYIWHCESAKEELAQVAAVGEMAQRAADKRAAKDKERKEKADAENKRLRTDLAALTKRLRDARGDYLPAPAPGAKRPDLATFERAELERAIKRLDDEISGIVAEGDQARVDLDTAKRWAQ